MEVGVGAPELPKVDSHWPCAWLSVSLNFFELCFSLAGVGIISSSGKAVFGVIRV